MLERGGYYDDEDFDGARAGGAQRRCTPARRPRRTTRAVGLVAGSCLGGGTVVNYSTSFRTPDDVRAEWAVARRARRSLGDEYSASLDAVCERLGVNQEHNEPSTREQKLRDACLALGWHVDAMPRNVTARCDQGRDCGYCGFGCRRGAKQSTAQDVAARRARGRRADRRRASTSSGCTVEGGAARGVERARRPPATA